MAEIDRGLVPMEPGGQLRLLPDEITDEMVTKREIEQGICTGVQLKSSDPALYEVVINLLAEGSLSQRKISRLTGVSRNLISGIVKSQAADIEPLKAKIAGQLSTLHQLCSERAIELVMDDKAKISLKDLMVGVGVSAEKFLLMTGQASSIVEFRSIDPGEDEFAAAIRRAKRVDCVDVEPIETGIEADNIRPKGAGEPDDEPVDESGGDDETGEQSGGAM